MTPNLNSNNSLLSTLTLLSKTQSYNSKKRRNLLKRVSATVAAGSTANGNSTSTTSSDVALNRYLELIATTRKSVVNKEGNNVELEKPDSKIKVEESTSTPTSESNLIKLNNSKKGESNPITFTDDVVGVDVGETETIAIQKKSSEPSSLIDGQESDSSCSDNVFIEKDEKKCNSTPNKKTKRNTTKTVCLKEEDLKRYEEMEQEQINAIRKINEARKEVHTNQVQNVWGVYTYGLKHVLGLNDLSDAPDAILPDVIFTIK